MSISRPIIHADAASPELLSPQVLARLGQLNRGPLPPPAPRPQPGKSVTGQLPSGREVETPHGRHWLIEAPLQSLWGDGGRWLRLCTTTAREHAPLDAPELQRLAQALPGSAVFLDLETCGFSGSMLFLVGLLVGRPSGLMLLQLLARNYAEERAVLHTFWNLAESQTVLVTFNGKSFDWPVLRDRTTLHRLRGRGDLADEAATHCDLLHHSRRRWKNELPNCRLQTLERHICRRRRRADIPGRDIPDAYHRFVRSGDPWEMRSVLHHNALDLITLLQLAVVLLRGERTTVDGRPKAKPA